MNFGVKVCESVKCKGTYFEEVYAAQIVPPSDNDECSESGKVTMHLGSGYYVYRCVECGRKYNYRRIEEFI